MGSTPYDTFRNIKQRLEEEPENISWTLPRKVCILKVTGKLGIKVKVYESRICDKTYAIVTRVKDECRLIQGHNLAEYERIISINNTNIETYTEDCVLHLLQTHQPDVELLVCRLDLKRYRDPSGSYTSEMSGRPSIKIKQVKPEESTNQIISAESLPDSLVPGHFLEDRNISVPVINSPSEMMYNLEPCTCNSLDSATRKPKPNINPKGNTEIYIKYPHCVKWSSTKTITLDRGNKQNFGFKYKIKQCTYRQDDWYTLVVEVKDTPAEGKLMIGDYIRSINGQALATPHEAFKMMDKLEDSITAKIVLQRPEDVVEDFRGKIQQAKDICSAKQINPAINEPENRKPMRQNSSTSQKSTGSGKLFPGEQKLMAVHPSKTEAAKTGLKYKQADNNTLVSGLFNVVRPGSSCSNSNESHMNFLENEKLVDNSEVHLIVPEPPVLNNNNQILSEFQSNRTVKLPKIRIFICGNEARALAKLLVPSSFLKTDTSSAHCLYECVKCTMDMSKAGDVSFMPWSSYDNLLQSEETTRLHASNDSLVNGEVNKQREEDYLHRGVVNTEIFIVPDEKLFQYGCHYLFTRTSLFLLTFNGAKVLNSAAGEILRLQNLIHTIRCCVGYDSNIFTFGLLNSEQADFKDEVQTLFYTSYGQQIRKYSVTIPDLIISDENSNQIPSKILKKNVWKAVSETIQKQPVSILSVVMMAQLERLRQEGKQIITEEEFAKMFKMAVPNGEPSLQHVVWTTLKEFGELLSPKAAPLNLPNNQQMEKLLFIDPEIILQHVQGLVCIPQRHSSSSDITKHWIKLVATGNISKEDLLSIISSQSINAEKILNLMLAFGMIFKHFIDQDGIEQYLFPYFLSEQGHINHQRTDQSNACLYLQCVDQTHLSSMQFYQLAFSISNQSDGNRISLTSAYSCTLHHQGHEITLVHHKFQDRMQIIIQKSERNKKLHYIYQWFCDVCHADLPPEVHYVLGPECPLQEDCEVKGSMTSMHVVDISSRRSILCKTTRIDNHKAVRRWLQDQSTEPKVYIKDLPYNVFHKLFTYLQCGTTLGQDWKGLSGLLGLSINDINVYETKKDPAMVLLLDQDQTNRLTVHELIELLDHPDMKRKDLIELLQNWLDSRNR